MGEDGSWFNALKALNRVTTWHEYAGIAGAWNYP